jgi:hypothetical protein
MSDSATAPTTTPDVVEDAPPQTHTQVSSVELPSTEVLITEAEVLFGTAATASLQRESASRRFVAVLHRMFAISTDASPARPRPSTRQRAYYLERARMAREMERL